jgi:DNA-binding MarR family transcriptional regulator
MTSTVTPGPLAEGSTVAAEAGPAAVLDELDAAIGRAIDALRSVFVGRAARLDLSPPLVIALKHLVEPMPMREMAARLMCDASNVTGVADRLEERGLVERRVDPADRRVKLLALTDRGREVVAQLGQGFGEDLPGLSRLTPEERQELIRLLDLAFGSASPG